MIRMSRLAAACALLFAHVNMASAQLSPNEDLLAYEGFEYDVGSSIEQLDGGSGWGTPWQWRLNFEGGGSMVTNSAIVEAGSLGYANLAVSGNHVRLTGANGELQLGRGFAEAIGGVPGTSTYISFVGQRVGPEADPSAPAYEGIYPWGENLYPRGTSVRFWNTEERLSIGNYSNQTRDDWAIYGSGLPLTHSDVSFSEGFAFVVIRIDHTASDGAVGDNIHMWVNPDLEQPEDLSAADIRLLNISEDAAPVHVGELTWVSPFAGHASTDTQQRILRPHAEMLLDELRVGRTYESVIPTAQRWAGFEMEGSEYVYTGSFLQWLYLTESGWNWSYSLEAWQFLRENWVSSAGAWVWVWNFTGETPAGGSGEGFWEGYAIDSEGVVHTGRFLGSLDVRAAPWVWSDALKTWLYVPGGSISEGGGYVYVFDSNPTTDQMPGKAIAAYPLDGDQHVKIGDDNVVTLEWRAGQRADTHHLYYGTDAEAVANATTESPEYLGEVDGESMEIMADFNSMERSYWRVDAVNEAGTAKGDVWFFRPAQLAFPGAEGRGQYALGGRHGRVVHVTNLNDSGPGSLRAAIEEEEGPRIVVFDVGGLITLEDDITIDENDTEVTVAGQTAPYPGITIRKNKFGVSGGEDVVVRFLRLKVGNLAEQTSDGTGMQGSNYCIMDHLSVGWSIDEAFSSRSAKNISLQRTILAEALNEAGHKNYPEGSQHGYAASVGGDIATFHHNLLAHCAGRNWSMAGGVFGGVLGGRLDFTNNVVYNWKHRTTDGAAREVNFVGNYYKGGPASTKLVLMDPEWTHPGTETQSYYVEGNILDVVPIPGINDREKYVGPENREDIIVTSANFPDAYVDAPLFDNQVDTHDAELAYKLVLSDVGANQPTVDDNDYRVIGDVLARGFTFHGSKTGLPGLIDNENDVGTPWDFYEVSTSRPEGFDTDRDGLPNWYEGVVGTDPNSPADDFSDMRSDPDGDGFTLMDDYLAWLAAPHVECDLNGSVEVDLAALTRGFTASPAYTIDAVTNGDAVVLLDGFTAKFTPDSGFTGLAEFTFTVTDAEGDSMTRTVGVRVKPIPFDAVSTMSLTGTTDLSVDVTPQLIFDREVRLGGEGEIRLHRASDDAIVDTLEMDDSNFMRIGPQTLQYHPVIIDGAEVYFVFDPSELDYGETYYVTWDTGVLIDTEGNPLAGVFDEETLRFSTAASAPASDATSLSVRRDGSGDFTTVQGAINHVPEGSERVTINIANGVYEEIVYIDSNKAPISLIGESREGVVIRYANNAVYNSASRASFRNRADDLTVENITFHNTTPKGGSQAEAFQSQARRVVVRNCDFLSYQDTVRLDKSAYFENCYIEGDVDFFWGDGVAYFDQCEIRSLDDGYLVQSRNEGANHGFIFRDCTLTAPDDLINEVYLARIGVEEYPTSEVVFLRCAMGPHIRPEGWLVNGADEAPDLRFYEYASTDIEGDPLDLSARHPSSTVLTANEAAAFEDLATVLGFDPSER